MSAELEPIRPVKADDDVAAEDTRALRPPSRREALGLMAMAPLVAALPPSLQGLAPEARANAARAARAAEAVAASSFEASFFSPHEMATVRILADMVIPADEAAGGALEAGVPEWLDFTMSDQESQQIPMRGGLRWLDAESNERHGANFVDLSEPERGAILDDIAFPDRAPNGVSQGVAFFNRFRDLVATGYFSSRVGVDYLKYIGNTVVLKWDGCPPEALRHLGLEP